MSAYYNRLHLLIAVVALGGGVCLGVGDVEADEAVAPVAAEAAGAEAGAPALPYLAKITGDNVNIRSGQAEIYPPVGQLNEGRRVIVKQELFKRWAKIYPTAECYSYIAKEYVALGDVVELAAVVETPELTAPAADDVEIIVAVEEGAADNAEAEAPSEEPVVVAAEPIGKEVVLGVVTANNVRVRAGAEVAPAYSDEVQTKLNKGDVVKIIGQRDDYFKIVCPPECYFYVSLDYIEKEGPASAELIAQMQQEIGGGVLAQEQATEPAKPSAEMMQRQEYNTLARSLETELRKPLAQRDFREIAARLDTLLAETESASIKARAEMLRRQLDRGQVAVTAFNELQQQDDELRVTLEEIDERLQLLVALNNPPEKTDEDIVLKGKLARSAVFTEKGGEQRFLVLDDDNKITYYAVSDRVGLNLNQWMGKKVSMVGRAEYDGFANVRVLKVGNLVELPPAAPE